MNTRELAELVRQMRSAQKRFFRGDRSSATLDESKRLGREVDRAVAEILDDRPSLFGKGGPG